ncbi:large conductance mechanosensitive channel protein MscL [Euzebya tangerina]|uniref:large conductance mechanosensitive channel protein MscL n=1 Tax=Euzebya tangerina TaxID=591198 RepID=UPI000E31622D|nr:large conductance mechanosensitive channel protein MscL [Euzebya tangerina]
MLQEFREFIMRGNVIDLAVAVVIGAAFAAIITALVEGIINPLIALLVGQPSITDVVVTISDTDFLVGQLIGQIINFVLVGFVLFLVVKGANKAMEMRKQPEDEGEPEVPEDVQLLRDIRDSLKASS